ncbi:PREDICTED: calumenin-like, partial [Acropora digitifera]|uniref:calumenin-like n=1 Tax=Acropora digitifera TaxID=70779 RepID=UPI00077AF1C6
YQTVNGLFRSIGLKPDVLKDLRLIQNRDKRRFDFVDTDNDGHLSREELTLFLHPEESKRMTSFIIQETLDMFDTNKDGKVSLSEYLGDESTRDSQNLKSLTRTFNIELDRNHDGFLDKREIQKWTLPGTDKDPIEIEAHHMMKMGDDNKDGFLQVDELVRHYREFAGSRVTKYGDLLKEEL